MLLLLKNAETYVSRLFKEVNQAPLTYNNYYFTHKLIERSNEIIKSENLSEREGLVVQLSLLFSKTGYITKYSKPYKQSKIFLEDFFTSHPENKELNKEIISCIEVLDNKTPKNLVQEVVFDVYYSDYGKKKYLKQSLLHRKEIEEILKIEITDAKWLEKQIDALKSITFKTSYAIKEWGDRKRKNLASLLNELEKKQKLKEKEKTKAYYKQKYKNESPERGIQTLYRVALRNHIKLSDIADTKANILLSVNAIIISLVIANLLSKLDNPSNRYLLFPTIVFVVFSIISMIMSIKATQPNVTRGEFTEEDLKAKKVNLAFFGNFHKIELSRYQTAFQNLIKSKEDVYNTLTKDLYFLGSILDSKYRLLRYTYFIFMLGIIISVITFALAFIYRDTITL